LLYLLLAIPVLIAIGLFYANRQQAHATLADRTPEPNLDLTYRPRMTADEDVKLKELLAKPRDPALAQLSQKDLVMAVLKECYDPEIPLNLVDLGLIYDVAAEKDRTDVRMSLTAPGCPSSETIQLDIRGKLEEAGFPKPTVEIVWEPRWTAHRISAEGRKSLGIDTAEAAAKLIPTYPDPGGEPSANETASR
jgi:metal-sulfur cluster biosynthetic enzyme